MDKSEDGLDEGSKEKDNAEEAEKSEDYAIVLSRKEATKELLGQVVYSEEEAYKLYCDYGHRVGFSVRKGKQSYFIGTKNIRTKDYYCSKEGLKYDEPITEANFNRPDTRTNCKAMIRFRVDEQGQWKVIRFVSEHNHGLATPGERHLLRSARTLAKPAIIESMVNAEVRPANPCSSIVEEVAMPENVGSTSRDCCNNSNVQSITMIEPCDSQSLVSYFKRRANEGMFYWDVQLDQEGRMINFFWRDGRNRNDYDCFGDVVVFDTACRSNKYNLICAPFLGLNHHLQNVMFGCAFLSDEFISSYVWLFKSFLESMGGQPPKSIITNQDEAVAKAVEEVFPDTIHRFSHWHIHRNAQSQLGTLNAGQAFQNMLTKCLQGCDTEMEFEETWATMIHEYRLQDHQWLTYLYELRHKWCTALNKDAFDGGIGLSQQSEGLNNVLDGIADESTSLTKFALSIEKLVKGWRKSESEEDFRCSQTSPVRSIKHSALLNHAAEVYTHRVYKLFEAEFLDGCGVTSYQETLCNGTLYRFELMMQGRGLKSWIVLLDTDTMEVTCSCKKFETMGILCSHALKTLNLKNVPGIPERYIMKRWTKDAGKRVYKLNQDVPSKQELIEAKLVFCNRTMHYAYNLIMKSQEEEESRKILLDTLESAEKALEMFLEASSLRAQSSGKDKETYKKEKRKKKLLKGETSSRKVKQAFGMPSHESEFAAPTNENQFYSAQDSHSNPTIGRPIYYQPYPTTGMPTNQIYVHPNMHPMPLCASQEFSAYGTMHPPPSTFGGAKNV